MKRIFALLVVVFAMSCDHGRRSRLIQDQRLDLRLDVRRQARRRQARSA